MLVKMSSTMSFRDFRLNVDMQPLFRSRANTGLPNKKLRVVVLGSKDVGKTSIVKTFVKQRFAQEYQSTDTDQRFINSDKVVVELMDTNDVMLPNLRKMTICTAEAFVLVYAVDNQSSFDNICSLRNDIIEIKGKDTPIVVVGNKVDVPDRSIHPVMADCVVTMDWECPHVEVSTKNYLQLTTIFRTLFKHPKLVSRVDALVHNLDKERSKPLDREASRGTVETGLLNSVPAPLKRKRPLSWTRFKKLFRQ